MLTEAEAKSYNNQLSHVPQVQDPVMNTNLPELNKLQHFDAFKQPCSLMSNHASSSMPVLPTQDQPMQYNQMPNTNSRPDFQVPQQPSVYPRYPQNNTMIEHTPQNVQTAINIPPSINISPAINIPAVDTIPSYAATTESTLVTFVDLKTFYEKGQCRLQGKSEQRLDYASSFVRIYLEKPDNIQVWYH